MIYLNAAFTQHHTPEALPKAVRAALGKPLRRAAPLTQLALVGALAGLPAERRHLPTALLWQSTSGARLETLVLLEEVCLGAAEPMPYEFLATQSTIAAAQIQPFLPGLQSSTHLPLDSAEQTNWSLLFSLAGNWLADGRYAQVLCAHLDHWADSADGHWLCLSTEPGDQPLASLEADNTLAPNALADTPDFPARLADWLQQPDSPALHLQSPAAPRLAVKFARL